MGTGICFKCGSSEHISSKCPRKNVRGNFSVLHLFAFDVLDMDFLHVQKLIEVKFISSKSKSGFPRFYLNFPVCSLIFDFFLNLLVTVYQFFWSLFKM